MPAISRALQEKRVAVHEFVPQAIDRSALRQLSRRSDARGCLQLAIHALLLGITGALVWASRGRYWLLPAIVLHGVVLDFLFCALHETVHRTAFASRRANDLVASICAALLLVPREYFRLFHFAHHRFTQDPAKDPELAQPSRVSLKSYLWRVSGLPYWYDALTVTLRRAVTGRVPEPFVPASKRSLIVSEARMLWTGYIVVLAVSLIFRRTEALLYWVLPAIAGQPFLRLYLMSEHTGCALGDDVFANTRTTYTNAAVRLLAWQMPFHVEHHAFPAVPFHALEQVNARIRGRIQVSSPGYLALHLVLIRRLQRRGRSR